jgi:hypothetical protein
MLLRGSYNEETMIVLDTTSKSITIVMSGAAATTNPSFTAAYADNNGTTFTEGANDGVLNGTTPVTVVAAPAASTRRIINTITVENNDTAAVTITVGYLNTASTRVIVNVTLQVGDTWTTDGAYDNTGSLKQTSGGGGSGATITNDTATASNIYPVFANALSGSFTTAYISNAKLLYKPSTGEFLSQQFNAGNGIYVNSKTVSTSYTIATGNSGMSAGPITIASGQTVTIASGSRWVVL